MGNYIDKTYFLKKMSEDKLNKLSRNDDNNLNNAIDEAESEADGYLRNVTSELPLTGSNITSAIKLNTYRVAVFNLHDGIQYDDIPDWVRDNYDVANNWWNRVSSGKVNLNITIADEDKEENRYELTDDDPDPLMKHGMH